MEMRGNGTEKKHAAGILRLVSGFAEMGTFKVEKSLTLPVGCQKGER